MKTSNWAKSHVFLLNFWSVKWLAAVIVALTLSCAKLRASTNVERPPDPGYEAAVIAADVIAEIEVVAGGPFRAVALVRKTLKGDAPKVIELEGFNSYNWDTVHHGLPAGARYYMFLSKTERPDLFVALTPATPRFLVTAEGVMMVFGDPPVNFPVKAAALEEGLSLLVEKSATGKTPQAAAGYLRGLWDKEEIEARFLAVEFAGALRDERAMPLLLEASKHKTLGFRLCAIKSLAKIGSPASLGVVRALLKDEKKSVAREAARVLAQIRDGESVPLLLEWVRKNAAAIPRPAGGAGETNTNSEQAKSEAVALDIVELAKAAGPFGEAPKIARGLLEIARMPNDKIAIEAVDASIIVSPIDSIPTLIELAQDRLYEHRERALSALRRVALKPVHDIDEFQAWWKDAGKKFNEDARRDAAEAAGRGLATADGYDERRRYLETLRNMPGGIGIVTASPFLLNPKASANFGEDDLAAWNSPLALPFLIERLGRDSATARKGALEAVIAMCAKNPRLADLCWPLIRAQLAERDSEIRRAAEAAIGGLSRAEGIDALFDAIASRGVYEPQDSGKSLYMITGRTLGFSINEPVTDQALARTHFRGWWDGARKGFRPLSISTPVNPFALYPADAVRIRVFETLDDSARGAKLEAQALVDDSDISEAAFGLMLSERGPGDGFWAKMIKQGRLRDRARGLVGSLGSAAIVPELIKRIDAKAEGETPLTRALMILSLAASGRSADSKRAGVKALVAWIKTSELPANHPLKRLAVVSLALANNEPESLKFLSELVESVLKDSPDPDLVRADDENGPYALFRSAVIALCARDDSNAPLLRLLNESGEARIRETAARALSLRRDRAAIPGIVKTLEKSDRYTWQDVTYVLEPLLNNEDGPVFCDLLDGSKNLTRAAGAWILVRRPELGNDPTTRAKLISAMSDDVTLVRYYAAEALGKRKTKAALDGLVKLLEDIDDDVRAAAAQAIGEIGDRDACLIASKAALSQFRVDNRWMKALAISGNVKWFADILKLANSNLYPEQRAGLDALSASDNTDAKERVLKTFRNDDETMQSLAADLLAARGDASLPLVQDDLASKDKAARARALHLLTRINTPKARVALKEALKAEDDPALKSMIEWGIARDSAGKN